MKQQDISVTVCVVTYNQEKWIRQTLDSIVSQQTDYKFEVIIGEDGGTDSTRTICKEYAQKYNYINLLPPAPNMGVTANWIRCIQAGKGKYIMTCAGDDYWHNPHKIQLQTDFMEQHPECVICHTDIDVLFENSGKIIHNQKQTQNIIPPQGRIQQHILHGKEQISAVTMCIRRDQFEKHIPTNKFVELHFPREDWPTLLILSAYGDILYIPVSTATYRMGQQSISNTLNYNRIIQRTQKDKQMLEFLYSLFPEWGPFNEDFYFDNIANHQIVIAAYHNNDYATAKKYAVNDKLPTLATRMAYTKITFKLYRWMKIK